MLETLEEQPLVVFIKLQFKHVRQSHVTRREWCPYLLAVHLKVDIEFSIILLILRGEYAAFRN
jgi:hypothetical protein